MIFASVQDAPRYMGIHPRLDQALALLTEDFIDQLPPGRVCLDGDALTAARFDLISAEDEGRLFEHHQKYIDIFTLTHGREHVDLARPDTLTLKEQRDDYWGSAGHAEQSLILRRGSFLILFPGEAHRPGMTADGPEPFSRIVFKILDKED